ILPERHDQGACAAADIVGPASRAPRVEVEIDAELAEPSHLAPGPRVGHAMDHPQRGTAEVTDARFYHVWRIEPQQAGHTQAALEGRKAAPLLLHETGIHADCRAKLAGGVGKAMHDRAEGKMAGRVNVARLHPATCSRNETVCRYRIGTRFGGWTVPGGEP